MPPTSERSPDPLLGQVIDDRYHLRRAIGRGGMGVIYEAEATRLGSRLCAVKVLVPEFTGSASAVARFAREAQVAARVKHPNVVEIFDTGTTARGLGYIAMELLTGESLDRTLRRTGPLPWPRAQHITMQLCRALAAAHAVQVVHRDIKPENCFRLAREDDDDFIKVLDFGIAKLIPTEESDSANRMTSSHSVIGTYAYMSIEQIDGEPIDHRADIWAVGVLLHEMLTGQLPFRGKNHGQIWRAIHEYDPLPMRSLAPQMHIPPAAEAIVRRALARPLAERYPTIEAMARAIARVQATGPARAASGTLAPPSSPLPPFAPAGSMTLAIAATQLADAPSPPRPTDPVRVRDFTERVPVAPAVDTAPDDLVTNRRPGPPGPAELGHDAKPTELSAQRLTRADPKLAQTAPSPTRPRPLLFLGLASLPVLALGTLLSLMNNTSLDPGPEPPLATAMTPTPEPARSPAPAPPLAPESAATPAPPDPATPGPTTTPRATKSAQKPLLSFHDRVKQTLRRLDSKVKAEACYANSPLTGKLELTITVAATTGLARLTLPALKRGSAITPCLERALKALTFKKGARGDTDYVGKHAVGP